MGLKGIGARIAYGILGGSMIVSYFHQGRRCWKSLWGWGHESGGKGIYRKVYLLGVCRGV
jgi:hypothetical protein